MANFDTPTHPELMPGGDGYAPQVLALERVLVLHWSGIPGLGRA